MICMRQLIIFGRSHQKIAYQGVIGDFDQTICYLIHLNFLYFL